MSFFKYLLLINHIQSYKTVIPFRDKELFVNLLQHCVLLRDLIGGAKLTPPNTLSGLQIHLL
jgi:hypothetical protein